MDAADNVHWAGVLDRVPIAIRSLKPASSRSSSLALTVHASALRSREARACGFSIAAARNRSSSAIDLHPSAVSSSFRRAEVTWHFSVPRRGHREH